MLDNPTDSARVRAKMSGSIIKFYHLRRANPVFHMDDLYEFIVSKGLIVAPASPCRILRMLRQEGKLDYTVSDRSNSQYTFHYQD